MVSKNTVEVITFDVIHVYLGLFYYVLGNIHPRLRAGLQTIQLVAVVKSDHIAQYGIDEVLQPFMADIQKLEKVLYKY